MTFRPRILIAEDESILALNISSLLTAKGFDVQLVTNALDALRSVEKRTPDVILLDIGLRGDLDGIQAAFLIRERTDMPILFMTAHADEKTRARAALIKPSGFLVKPVYPQIAVAHVAEVFRKSRSAGGRLITNDPQ